MNRLLLAATMLPLAGCSVPLFGSTEPQPSADAIAACQRRGDQVFLSQNRDAIYKADRYQSSLRDSPYSNSGLPETSANLSAQYERNEDVRNCLNGEATPLSPKPAAKPGPPPAP